MHQSAISARRIAANPGLIRVDFAPCQGEGISRWRSVFSPLGNYSAIPYSRWWPPWCCWLRAVVSGEVKEWAAGEIQ